MWATPKKTLHCTLTRASTVAVTNKSPF
uniref:Uncharacterized protein n=1 Tax=Anguilla anguilla TaxID=7936 RepID=A0A0E9XZF1_ANGAN